MAVVGWILLGILGLLLLILLLVLFVPISYRLEAEKNPEHLTAKVRVSWLLGLIQLLFFYPEPGEPKIKIAWFTLNQKKKNRKRETGKQSIEKSKKKKEKKIPVSAAEAEQTDTEESAGTEGREMTGENPTDSPPEKEDTLEAADDSRRESSSADPENGIDAPKPEDTSKKKGASKADLLKMYQRFKAEAGFFQKLWQKEDTKALVSELFARILKILQNLIPKKIEGRIVFGANTPDITGYVLAVYSIARVKFPRRLSMDFTPDFEEQVLKGELLVKGHVMLVTLVWNGLRMLLDKRLWRLWRQIEKHIS